MPQDTASCAARVPSAVYGRSSPMKKVYSLKRLGDRELDSIPAQVGLRQVVMGVDVAKHELVLMMRCGNAQFGDAQFIGPYRAMNPGQIGQMVELARRLSLD